MPRTTIVGRHFCDVSHVRSRVESLDVRFKRSLDSQIFGTARACSPTPKRGRKENEKQTRTTPSIWRNQSAYAGGSHSRENFPNGNNFTVTRTKRKSFQKREIYTGRPHTRTHSKGLKNKREKQERAKTSASLIPIASKGRERRVN